MVRRPLSNSGVFTLPAGKGAVEDPGVHLWGDSSSLWRRAMDRSADPTDVMLIDEVARALKITPKQIRRLEQRGAFPIPRLPKLDRHPRYARRLVERFAAGDALPLLSRRRRIA